LRVITGNIIRRIRYFGILVFLFFKSEAQEVHFSQFYASPLYLAPSFAGTTKGTRIAANFRNQWPQISHGYLTYAFGIDHSFADFRNGIGFQAIRDQKGELGLNTTLISFHYSYVVYASRKISIRPGLQFNYIMNGLDYSKIRTRDMIVLGTTVPMDLPQMNNYQYMDVAGSVLVYTNNLWAGIKADHLMRPAQVPNDKYRTPIYISVFGGFTQRFHNRLNKLTDDNVSYAFNYVATDQFSQLDVGLMGLKNNIQVGLWYRGIPAFKEHAGSDAMIISIGYIFYDLTIGYSHDFTISGLNNFSNGSDEISLIYVFNQDQKPKKKRAAIKCPRFSR
jgi:type IX secretion system PorP/SprF family membrane protein